MHAAGVASCRRTPLRPACSLSAITRSTATTSGRMHRCIKNRRRSTPPWPLGIFGSRVEWSGPSARRTGSASHAWRDVFFGCSKASSDSPLARTAQPERCLHTNATSRRVETLKPDSRRVETLKPGHRGGDKLKPLRRTEDTSPRHTRSVDQLKLSCRPERNTHGPEPFPVCLVCCRARGSWEWCCLAQRGSRLRQLLR